MLQRHRVRISVALSLLERVRAAGAADLRAAPEGQAKASC
jgi:hypothetical protein